MHLRSSSLESWLFFPIMRFYLRWYRARIKTKFWDIIRPWKCCSTLWLLCSMIAIESLPGSRCLQQLLFWLLPYISLIHLLKPITLPFFLGFLITLDPWYNTWPIFFGKWTVTPIDFGPTLRHIGPFALWVVQLHNRIISSLFGNIRETLPLISIVCSSVNEAKSELVLEHDDLTLSFT